MRRNAAPQPRRHATTKSVIDNRPSCCRADCGSAYDGPEKTKTYCYRQNCTNAARSTNVRPFKVVKELNVPALVCFTPKEPNHRGHKTIRKPCARCPNYNTAFGFNVALKEADIPEDTKYPIIIICDDIDKEETGDMDDTGKPLAESTLPGSSCIIS